MRPAGPWAAGLVFAVASAAAAAPAPIEDLTIRVVAPSGKGIPGACVRPVRQTGEHWVEHAADAEGVVRLPGRDHRVETRSGKDGTFVLGGLDPSARYACRTRRDDGAAGEAVEVDAGTAELLLFAIFESR